MRAFLKKVASKFLILVLSFSLLLAGKAIAASADHVVISEVQTSGTIATTDDFIELYNPTTSASNLKGFRLARRSQTSVTDTTIKSWTTDTFIPPGGFYLWANSGYSAIAATPDAATTATIADNNSVALRQGAENTGLIVDSLAWGSGHDASLGEGAALGNILPGKSLERKANALSTPASMAIGGFDEFKGNAWDTGENSADLILRSNPKPQNSLSPSEKAKRPCKRPSPRCPKICPL